MNKRLADILNVHLLGIGNVRREALIPLLNNLLYLGLRWPFKAVSLPKPLFGGGVKPSKTPLKRKEWASFLISKMMSIHSAKTDYY